MLNSSTQRMRAWSYCVLPLAWGCSVAQAHVGLDSPVGGESIAGGFVFPIKWHVAAQHNTLDWDLWFSTESSSGPWTEIAMDLPKGGVTTGSSHTYDWHVPNLDITSAWVRVRQDNSGMDYYDISSASFNVFQAESGDFTGDGLVNTADLSLWETGFGISTGAFFTDGDDDSDGDVDGFDFLRWQSNFQAGSALSVAVGVPEPASLLLILIGSAPALLKRRHHI